jgi:23S rRNA pseudouridine1911/1915/1917 synthase
MPYADYGQAPKAQDLNLEVLFEDEQIIVINKAAGIAVHPGLGEYQNTLLNGLLYHFESKGLENTAEPFFVQRLDKHTSGVMVIAKTLMANDFLQQQFSVHAIERSYVCQVWGNPLPEKGTLKSHIGRNPLNERLIQVSHDKSFGKSAITHYQVLQKYSHSALVECKLETGRTHQIRIHMQHLGHSLVGDQRYPNKAIVIPTAINERANLLMPHQALHAQTLGFINPTDKQYIRFEVKPPIAFQMLQDYLSTITATE